jgi:hypothetical protein
VSPRAADLPPATPSGRALRPVGARAFATRSQPGHGRLVVVRLAVAAIDHPLGAEFDQSRIELAAESAELVVAGVSKGQDGEPQCGSHGALRSQGRPRRRPRCRGHLAEGARHYQRTSHAGEFHRGRAFHADPSGRMAFGLKPFLAAPGRFLGVAGLRGPNDQDLGPGRCLGGLQGRLSGGRTAGPDADCKGGAPWAQRSARTGRPENR